MMEKEKVIEQLMSFGFAKDVAEMSLKESGGTTVDDVLDWIENVNEQKELAKLYEKRLMEANISDGNKSGSVIDLENDKKKEMPKLTEEEKQKKAVELQRQIRERNLKRAKQEELERERKRTESAKAILEQRQHLEELERKLYISSLLKEREESAKEKQRQLEKFKQEYKERFGIEYKPEEKKKTIDQLSGNEKREQIAVCINTLVKKQKDKKKETIASLNILKTYISNIKNNILEKKYQTIKKNNKVFSEKISIYEELIYVLQLLGFVDSGETYTMKGVPDTYLLASALRFIDLAVRTFEQ